MSNDKTKISSQPVDSSMEGTSSTNHESGRTSGLSRGLSTIRTAFTNLFSSPKMVDGGVRKEFPTELFKKSAPASHVVQEMVDGGVSARFPIHIFERSPESEIDLGDLPPNKPRTLDAFNGYTGLSIMTTGPLRALDPSILEKQGHSAEPRILNQLAETGLFTAAEKPKVSRSRDAEGPSL